MNATKATNGLILGIALAAGVTACDKKGSPDGTAAPSASGASTTVVNAAAAPNALGATCNDPDTKICKEYLGAVPLLAADFCKGPEGHGVFTKGGAPCSREKLSGTCAIKTETGSELHLYYLQGDAPESDQADVNKVGCEMKEGKWTAAPTSPKPTSAAPAAAKPSKKK